VNVMVGEAYVDMHQLDRGLEHARRGAQQALASGGMECACGGFATLGLSNLRVPNPAAAEEALNMSLSLAEKLRDEPVQVLIEDLLPVLRGAVASAQFAAGRVEAVEEMEAALEATRARGDEYATAAAAHTVGDAYLQLRDLQRAEPHLRSAYAYYHKNGMRPYVLRVLQSLANLYEGQSRTAEAQQARADAIELERQLGLAGAAAP
jgi:tetratricopeptide (TPR) repeat protein